MTEQEWLACEDLSAMQDSLNGQHRATLTKAGRRKLRFFVCACCRQVWSLLSDDCRQALEIAEQYADGLLDKDQLKRAERTSQEAMASTKGYPERSATQGVREATRLNITVALKAAYWTWGAQVRDPITPGAVRQPQGREAERSQRNLLHHIFGNPFRPHPVPTRWPSSVVSLADALYQGQDCTSALHDALLEAGRPELAEHFHQEKWHPKGCWVLDLILQKK